MSRTQLALLACLVAFSLQATHATQPRDTETLYQGYCARCHGKRGQLKLGKIPRLRTSILQPEEVSSRIQVGSGADMPAFADSLSAVELEAMVDYVIALRK